MVEDPIFFFFFSQILLGKSAHLFMTCLDLRMSMLSVESGSNVYVLGYGLILAMEWLSSKGDLLGFEKMG